jgi:hypothetical protein
LAAIHSLVNRASAPEPGVRQLNFSLSHSFMKLASKNIIAATLCFVFFVLFYGISSRSEIQVSDEAATFATGISLATQGDLVIDELQWLQDRVNIGQKGRGEHLYAKYFLGNTLSAAIIYLLAEKQPDQPYNWNSKELAPSITAARLVLKLNALFGAVAMTALLLTTRRYFSWKTAIATVLAIGLGSDWWYQSRGFFSEVGAGSFLMLCLYFADSERPYLSSLALSISLLFRPTNLLGLPIWGKSLLEKKGLKVASGIFILISLAILGFYNWFRFNSPLTFGYGSEQFNSSIVEGLYGILFSPGRSIFVYSPILILSIWGGYLFYQREPRLVASCLPPILGYIVTISMWHSWHGGWTWGSRLLTPIIPLLGFLTASVIEKVWSHKLWLILVVVLIVLGISIQLIALARDPLGVMIELVVPEKITFEETLYTVHNSWLAMQVRSLSNWKLCDIDSHVLRDWINTCGQ